MIELEVSQASDDITLTVDESFKQYGSLNDYNSLDNKPSISGAMLVKGMTLSDIGITKITNQEIKAIFG